MAASNPSFIWFLPISFLSIVPPDPVKPSAAHQYLLSSCSGSIPSKVSRRCSASMTSYVHSDGNDNIDLRCFPNGQGHDFHFAHDNANVLEHEAVIRRQISHQGSKPSITHQSHGFVAQYSTSTTPHQGSTQGHDGLQYASNVPSTSYLNNAPPHRRPTAMSRSASYNSRNSFGQCQNASQYRTSRGSFNNGSSGTVHMSPSTSQLSDVSSIQTYDDEYRASASQSRASLSNHYSLVPLSTSSTNPATTRQYSWTTPRTIDSPFEFDAAEIFGREPMGVEGMNFGQGLVSPE